MEFSETFRVVNALFEVVELRFAHAHLSVHLEQAFSRFIERFKAYRLELETKDKVMKNNNLLLRVAFE